MLATTIRNAKTPHSLPLTALFALSAAACMLWAPLEAAAESPREQRPATDRGEASMRIGDVSWQAGSATARLRGTSLNVSAMHSSRVADTVVTERLSLQIPAYRGPGRYAAASGSNFVRAGITIPKDTDDSAGAASGIVSDALKGARMIRLDHAEIEIDGVVDGFVKGRFRLESAAGNPQPSIADGVFRARLRDGAG